MVVGALGVLTAIEPPRSRRPDLVLRLKLDALRLQGAMIDARVYIERSQALVDMIGPRLAPFLQQRVTVPLTHLLTKPLRPDFAHRQHHMCVGLGVSVLADVPMHIEVRDHPALNELLFDEIAGELNALLLVHLARD